MFKQFIISLSLTALLAIPFTALLSPHLASAQTPKQAACQGVDMTGGDCNSGGAKVSELIQSLVNILSGIVGVAAVIMIIVGGLKYVTSGGDANKITSSKQTVIYAIVGLIIVAFAQIIVQFVLAST